MTEVPTPAVAAEVATVAKVYGQPMLEMPLSGFDAVLMRKATQLMQMTHQTHMQSHVDVAVPRAQQALLAPKDLQASQN